MQMTPKDRCTAEFEGTITNIEQIPYKATKSISLFTLRVKPFAESYNPITVYLYAFGNTAKYYESQLSINDRIYAICAYSPFTINNTIHPWFFITKIFIVSKYFGLNLLLQDKENTPQ